MTDDGLPPAEPPAKAGGGDFLRSVAEAVVRLPMETDVEGVIGAGRHERSGERTTCRNGYRDRTLDTRVGSLQLRIPKPRQGSHFPPSLESRKTSEKAPVAVIPSRPPARLRPSGRIASGDRRGSGACPRGGWTTWSRRWGRPASARARFPSCARTSTTASAPPSTARYRAAIRPEGRNREGGSEGRLAPPVAGCDLPQAA